MSLDLTQNTTQNTQVSSIQDELGRKLKLNPSNIPYQNTSIPATNPANMSAVKSVFHPRSITYQLQANFDKMSKVFALLQETLRKDAVDPVAIEEQMKEMRKWTDAMLYCETLNEPRIQRCLTIHKNFKMELCAYLPPDIRRYIFEFYSTIQILKWEVPAVNKTFFNKWSVPVLKYFIYKQILHPALVANSEQTFVDILSHNKAQLERGQSLWRTDTATGIQYFYGSVGYTQYTHSDIITFTTKIFLANNRSSLIKILDTYFKLYNGSYNGDGSRYYNTYICFPPSKEISRSNIKIPIHLQQNQLKLYRVGKWIDTNRPWVRSNNKKTDYTLLARDENERILAYYKKKEQDYYGYNDDKTRRV